MFIRYGRTLAAALFALALVPGSSAFAQIVDFHSVPTSNTCVYPWVITMQPPGVWIAPQDAKVLDLRATSFDTPFGTYVAVGNFQINPGNLCFFEACTPASITLSCASIGDDNVFSLEDELSIELDAVD
ncbi:MAG: hypothetical protein JJ902_22315 [Roseibium sp.]|nr:hypothetical protein [Roseibium sp.]